MDNDYAQLSSMDTELLFLITKYLESGPCKLSARVLKQELTKKKVLPRRLDWEGEEHEQSFNELEKKYPHIQPTHLLDICSRISPILDREVKPNVAGLKTLLGAGRQSLLRTPKDVDKLWMFIVEYSARHNHRALYPPITCTNHNIVKVLCGRENAGPVPRSFAVSNQMYSKTQLLCCTLGHLSAVYCLLFDHTGKYVVTGADDLLVKVWSAIDGRLLATLRGASAEISDITINVENTLLAAGSIDRLIRVWCLQTGAPVANLTAHTGMITGLNFGPAVIDGKHYLASTSSDGSVAIWCYTTTSNSVTFNPKPFQFIERMRPGNAQMICAAWSAGGMFLAAGSADHYVRVYKLCGLNGPHRTLEVEAHTDRVDSIQWANRSLRFVSGSKDGTALIWRYLRQEWKPIRLNMTTALSKKISVLGKEEEAKQKPKVTMVSWDCKDKWIVTACSDHTLKVWDSYTGALLQVLVGHKDETFVLEGHPLDPEIFMSAGHDGMILLWNVITGKMIASFQNNIENQGHGAVFDGKWSPDGTMLAATDSHGQILMFGLGSKPAKMLQLPKELFFHTDYRPLVRDSNHVVLDEQTQVAPHLMPPPFLVDVDGAPYPPNLQRLVPGRENCTTEQLVPNIILNQEGQQEVIQGVQEARSNIDQMIQALVHVVDRDQQSPPAHRMITSPRARMGARREGDVEGVRQSRGNWQRDEIRWTQRQMIRPIDKATLAISRERIFNLGELEIQDYERESLKPKEEPPRPPPVAVEKKLPKKRPHAYWTRVVREEELQDQFEDPDNLDLSRSEDANESDSTACLENLDSGSTSSSESASSEYSDWVKDEGEVLEPPKRKSVRLQKSVSKITKKTENAKEVPDGYRPSEWLSAVIPKKFPYYPQMGDEIMFFKEGYQLYLDAVTQRKIYNLTSSQHAPWGKINIEEPELVKVVGIRYEVRPPHLCCLRLAVMTRNGHLSGQCFTIKYHDIPDVIDFFVLKQTYDNAVDRRWEIGDRFRSMIDDHWWWGKIDGRRFTNSTSEFMKYRIVWDNGESEFLSPWDMEPVEPQAEPVEVGGSIPVSSQEIAAILYRPRADEWPLGDRDAACERILMGLEQVMELAVAEPFIAPVDLNRYPSYATVVEYPIDLSTIKARFDNRFYRRITAAQFDIRYLATNTEKFNEAHSYIVKQARVVTDLCLKIVKETCTVDVSSLYRQLLQNYHSSDSDAPPEPGPSTSRHGMKTATARSMRASRREASRLSGPFDWKRECRDLLEMLWACRDSEPFREPMDRIEHPEYYRVVDTPMDLGTMREELRGDNYETPEDFRDDLRRIFTNTKNYITDKRSRVFTMAVRLSALAEQNMNRILNMWSKLNKKRGVKKRQSRRKLLMSEDENASVSEYEPPKMTKKGERKKRQLSDDEPSSTKGKSVKSKKRMKRRLSDSDEELPEHDASNLSTFSSRVSKKPVRFGDSDNEASDSDGDYRPFNSGRTRKRVQRRQPDSSERFAENDSRSTARVSKKPVRYADSEDNEGSDSDGDYRPFHSVVNGHSRKRKSFPRQSKNSNFNNESDKRNITTGSLKLKIHTHNGRMCNDSDFGPSTSKTALNGFRLRSAKMIHVEKKSDSSDVNDDESGINTKKRINNTFNGKANVIKSESESEEEANENNEADSNTCETTNSKSCEENGAKDEEDQSGNEEAEKESLAEESSEENEASSDNSDSDFKVEEEKPIRKTVKVLYPKRRIQKSESDSEHSKENCVNSKNSLTTRMSKKINKATKDDLQSKVGKGKYPLRQTTKKNLAEPNTDESNDDQIAPYKTRRSTQMHVNGLSKYVESPSGSEIDSEDESANLEEDDSEGYSPPVKIYGRGRKRRRSSDSMFEWNTRRSVNQKLRKSGSANSANKSVQRRVGRNRRRGSSVKTNSDSEASSNNSDSESKTATVSVSSRGRVRKLTARARALLRD